MLQVFEQLASGNTKGGFPLSRIVCHMEWAADGRSHVDDLVEFESRVNDVWRHHDDAVICTYDLAKFGGDTVIDIMRTHPMIIIGGILQYNPFLYLPKSSCVKFASEGSGGRRAPDNGGLTWACDRKMPPREIKHLKRCLNDLVSVLALPAMWSGSQPSQIVHTLLDALLDMLYLDLVYARFEDPAGGAQIEVLKIAPSAKWMLPDEIHKTVNQWFGDDPQKWPSRLRVSIAGEDISIVSQRCGLHGEIGVIVAGSDRADFPGQTETLLLNVAANEAVIGLHEARLLLEQRRVAGELDRRVAQRTAELAAVNDELRKEIAERHRAEEALLENELNSRLILHSIPGLVCTMSPAGEVDRFNPQILEYFGKTPEELKGWAISDAVHPDDLPRVVAAFTHSITNRNSLRH